MAYLLSYIVLGALAGVLAGMLGVGGGIVIVPALTFLFSAQAMHETHIVHMALGTSLASIVFTSVASFRAHHNRGSVDWQVFRRITPGVVSGTLAGTCLAARLSTIFLKGFFSLFLFYVALQIILDIRPKPSRRFPGAGGMFTAGGAIGLVSSLVGIGGGTMSVPFLVWCNAGLRNAIGTASSIGFPIAVAGAAGYAVNGMTAGSLPPFTLGFIYLPALACIAVASVTTAPLGVRLAHSLPIPMVRKVFALFVFAVATKMLAEILFP